MKDMLHLVIQVEPASLVSLARVLGDMIRLAGKTGCLVKANIEGVTVFVSQDDKVDLVLAGFRREQERLAAQEEADRKWEVQQAVREYSSTVTDEESHET